MKQEEIQKIPVHIKDYLFFSKLENKGDQGDLKNLPPEVLFDLFCFSTTIDSMLITRKIDALAKILNKNKNSPPIVNHESILNTLPAQIKYYLLGWKDAHMSDYIRKYGELKLKDFTIDQIFNFFHYATVHDSMILCVICNVIDHLTCTFTKEEIKQLKSLYPHI